MCFPLIQGYTIGVVKGSLPTTQFSSLTSHFIMNTIYTLKFAEGYSRLPYAGEVVNTNKSLGWGTDPTETKTLVTYTPTENAGEFLFFTVTIKRTMKPSTFQGKTPYEVVRVLNSGYTNVSPGMKSQEVLSQFM